MAIYSIYCKNMFQYLSFWKLLTFESRTNQWIKGDILLHRNESTYNWRLLFFERNVEKKIKKKEVRKWMFLLFGGSVFSRRRRGAVDGDGAEHFERLEEFFERRDRFQQSAVRPQPTGRRPDGEDGHQPAAPPAGRPWSRPLLLLSGTIEGFPYFIIGDFSIDLPG